MGGNVLHDFTVTPSINIGGSGNWLTPGTYVQPSIQFQNTSSNALYTSAASALSR